MGASDNWNEGKLIKQTINADETLTSANEKYVRMRKIEGGERSYVRVLYGAPSQDSKTPDDSLKEIHLDVGTAEYYDDFQLSFKVRGSTLAGNVFSAEAKTWLFSADTKKEIKAWINLIGTPDDVRRAATRARK